MTKSMARIKDGTVINLETHDISVRETDELKNTRKLIIKIGDAYENGRFYRDNIENISYREQLRKIINEYDTALTEIVAHISAPIAIFDDEELTIEKRKQAILARATDMLIALDDLKKRDV